MKSESDDAPHTDLIERVLAWAVGEPDIRGVVLVGSYARRAAQPESDVDIIVLTTELGKYVGDDAWVTELGIGELIATKDWGAITERRLRRDDGLEVEIGFGKPSWASTDPIDPRTQRVVQDGMSIVYDPEGVLARLVGATDSSTDDGDSDPLETERLRLQPLHSSAKRSFERLSTDPKVTRFLGDGSTWSSERIEEVFERLLDHWREHDGGNTISDGASRLRSTRMNS